MKTAKFLASIFIFMSFAVQAQYIEEQEANKVVTDFLSKAFIIVKPINVNGNKITYKAIVADRKCNVVAAVTQTPEGTKRVLIEKLNCSK
ncbi:exported hypothetical protein [Xenorhabdus cabanillasii JM26]|uniref:Uncharacterized protein n=2 Tax=Xenorhabdus cabanillasii TaxID=351673 RepID=W1J6P9_9GAMM|nr:hypothetical protein Xcab_04010 [Xenorhabdus cabanillasii JM26]CDL85536.1 exported hypothetical protein [Xenorhabdus cabanillasii JM26]